MCGVVGGAGGVGSLVDIFAVDVNCVGHECGASLAVTGVATLKTPDFDSGLDTVEDTHVDCRGEGWRLG